MVGGSASYQWQSLLLGGQFKYVDVRQVTALNDLQVPSYVTVDVYARYDLDFVRPGTYAQLNINNLFNQAPPYPVGTYTYGYYDYIGRYFLLGVDAHF